MHQNKSFKILFYKPSENNKNIIALFLKQN